MEDVERQGSVHLVSTGHHDGIEGAVPSGTVEDGHDGSLWVEEHHVCADAEALDTPLHYLSISPGEKQCPSVSMMIDHYFNIKVYKVLLHFSTYNK